MPETQAVTNAIKARFMQSTAVNSSSPRAITSTKAYLIANSNANRKYIMMQNNSTATVLIRCGSSLTSTYTISSTKYHILIGKCTAARDGTGGVAVIDNFTGEIWGKTTAGTGSVGVLEIS